MNKKIYVNVALLYTGLSIILRVFLWESYGKEGFINFTELPFILAIGLTNDLLVLCYILFPITLCLLLVPKRLIESNYHKHVFATLVFVTIFILLFINSAEIAFFDEFNSRFNLVAVDYILYPTEVLGNINESYPMVSIIVTLLLISIPLSLAVQMRCLSEVALVSNFRSRAKFFVAHLVVVILLSLSWSAESFNYSDNRVVNQLANNGIANFFMALRNENIEYDQFYNTLPLAEAYTEMRQYLATSGGTLTKDAQALDRRFSANADGLGKLNVVILSEESFGAQYVGAYGDNRNLTPNFDKLSKEGLLFTNAFATGTRTVRGLEAMTTSFPPIPSESILKRPGNEDVANIADVLKPHGYKVSFLYGGFGIFDNMNYFFSHNGWDISDRMDIKNPRFSNIWGVSDEDLFDHALKYFDNISQQNKPFFSLIMTTSNHKPFTFPENTPGIPASGGGRDAGIKYADYAIGQFFKKAVNHQWFKNTIFVVIADHDSRVYGRAFVPVEHYRIPALIYAPGIIAHKDISKTFSQIDLAPTLLGLLGLKYKAPFYGVDVLNPYIADSRPVLLSHNHNVAIYEKDKISVLGLKQSVKSFSYRTENREGITEPIELDEKNIRLATAYFQTGYDLFKNKRYN